MTELIWDGKYDEKGRKVAPPRIALPFQTVETINESAADRDRMQDLFATCRPTEWRDRAARLWCANATQLTARPWSYVKVPQAGFDRLQPGAVADLTVFEE